MDEQLKQASLDQERAARSLNRASWSIVAVLGALAVSMWIAPFARASGHLQIVRVLGVGAFFEFFGLIALVVILRRRLANQLDRSASYQEILSAQNERLETQNRALEESERQQRRLADESLLLNRRLAEANRVAHLGYWEIDHGTGSVYWSDEMYRLAGLEIGIQPPSTDRFMQVVHPDDRERMVSVAAAAVRDLTEFTEQYRLVLPDGAQRTVQAMGRLVVDDAGGRRLVGTVQDVTERVQLETQLRRSQKMDAIGQLAGGVAHDFNNVLTVIEGYTSILLVERPAGDPDLAALEEIRDAARRAASLTRQLLAFSRQQVLQPTVLNLNEAIGEIEKMLARLIGEHIEYQTKLDPALDTVRADAGQLQQVLMNLVVNARDAMVRGGVMTIETANVVLDAAYASRYPNVRPGSYVMLAVSDTGTGIAPADLDRIFEPFFTTKESGKGTGLGLSTVLGIVEQSGGYISVYSEVGRGSSFKVYLPRVNDAERASHPPSAVPRRRGSETILLVEDDRAVRAVAAAVLRSVGYTIIETEDGVQALRVCQDPNASFDLVLSDMVMPGLGGRALAGHVQRIRPDVPVLLMSGYTRDAMVHNAELGASSLFVEKPFTPEVLTQKVRDALDRNPVRASAVRPG